MPLLSHPSLDTSNEVDGLDLVFVLDTTGSMGPLLQAAREQMTTLLSSLAGEASLRVGFVEYRDHPPQDTLLTRVHDFSPDLRVAQKAVDGFSAQGGGDGPEAVFDGVVAATEMNWRRHARRLIVLIGDAPPHGVGARGDGFPKGCPCGETPASVSAKCEEARVTLYALGLQREVEKPFEWLATSTGGEFWLATHSRAGSSDQSPMARLRALLDGEAAHLQFDRQTLALWNESPGTSVDELAQTRGCGRGSIASSLARLGRRELI